MRGASLKSGAPNDRWKRSPFGQIEKCAEAAALRLAFPEEIGNDYAAEEMEGQSITIAQPKESTIIDNINNIKPTQAKKFATSILVKICGWELIYLLP